MRWSLLPLCLLAVSCSKGIVQIDPRVQPYVDRYVQEAQKVGKTITIDNLIVKVAPLDSQEHAGECTRGGSSDTPTITLNQSGWDILDDTLREELVFHELGHCVLSRNHNNDLDQFGTPVSIMYWQMSPESVYSYHKAEWIIEMFYYDGPSEDGSNPGTTIN